MWAADSSDQKEFALPSFEITGQQVGDGGKFQRNKRNELDFLTKRDASQIMEMEAI